MQDVCQPSYAMDGHMEPSSLHYHCRCLPRFEDVGDSFGNMVNSDERDLQSCYTRWYTSENGISGDWDQQTTSIRQNTIHIKYVQTLHMMVGKHLAYI